MAWTELVVDNFSGADDADIAGRVPDGGGDGAKAVGVWGANAAWFGYGQDAAPDNTIDLVANKLRQLNGDDFYDSVYTVRSIPGISQDQYAKVTGRFHSLANDSYFGVALRFHDTDEVGFYVFLGGDSVLRFAFSSPTAGFVIHKSQAYAVATETDYTIVAAIIGPVLRVHINDVEARCQPISLYYDGSPGVHLWDGSGTGADISLSHFSAGNGDPYESLGGGAQQFHVRHGGTFKLVTAAAVRHMGEWKSLVKQWVRQSGAWHVMADTTGGEPEPTCGEKIAAAFRCLQGTSTTIRGPDGAALAQTRIDVTADTKVESTAVHDGGEMIIYGSLTTGSTAALNKMFVPGATGSGVNVIDKTTNAVSGWATPATPFGCASRGRRDFKRPYTSLGYDFISGAARTEQPIGERVYFEGAATVSITVDDHTYYNDYGGAGGAMRLFWDTTCTADIAANPPGTFPQLLATIGPTTVAAFPGHTYPTTPDANSVYITNYLEIFGDGTAGSTSFRYGVICSRKAGHTQPMDMIIDATDPGTDCEVTSDNEDTSFTFFSDVENWEEEAEALYVGAKNSGTVWALDPSAAGAVLYSFDTGLSETRGMAMLQNEGDMLVVVGGGLAKCFAVGTNAEVWSTAIGDGPYFVYEGPNDKVWISNTDDGTVTVLAAATGAVLATVTVGSQPHQIVRHARANLMYVANTGDGTVSLINPTTYAVERTLTVLDDPWGVAYDQTNAVVWVGHATVRALLAA